MNAYIKSSQIITDAGDKIDDVKCCQFAWIPMVHVCI